MAHYDKDTKKFIDDVSDKHPVRDRLVKSTISVAKQVARGKNIGDSVIKQVIAAPTFAMLEKQAHMKVMEIFKLLNSHYNHDWWDWEPETIWQTLEQDHQLEPTEAVKNIVQALQVVVKTDAAFEHWHIFEKVGQAFNKSAVNFGILQPLDPDEAALTVKIIQEIRPKAFFDDEVKAYIATSAKMAGVVLLSEDKFPPGCQRFLDDLGNNLELKDTLKTGTDEMAVVQRGKLSSINDYVKENL